MIRNNKNYKMTKRYIKKTRYKALIIAVIASIFILSGCSKNDDNQLKMLILGDSISEGAGVSDLSLKWYKFLSPFFEENYGIGIDINNISMGGTSSDAGYCRLMQQDVKDSYDIIIICYGENDVEEDFGLYYESILWNISKKYPNATVYSILESSQREYTAKIQVIQKLCEYYGVEAVDTITAFTNSGYSYEELCDDGTHPNDLGHQVYYETVKKQIENRFVLNENGQYVFQPNSIAIVDSPCDERLLSWGDFSYFSGEDIVKGRAKVEEAEYMVGIDYDCIDGEHDIIITSADNDVYNKHISWNYGFIQRHVDIIKSKMRCSDKIFVDFSSDEQKEHFYGICVTRLN